MKDQRFMEPQIRYFFYDLFFSMFVREPTDQVIDAWRTGLRTIRDAEPDDVVVARAAGLLDLLDADGANEAVRSECLDLFWALTDGPAVSLLASPYVDGKPFGEYLVRLRTFIEKTPFRKCDDYIDPEDSLAFHLDLMRSLIREQSETTCPQERDGWLALQDELLNDLLLTWVNGPLDSLEQCQKAPFYQAVAPVVRLWLDRDGRDLLEWRGQTQAAGNSGVSQDTGGRTCR